MKLSKLTKKQWIGVGLFAFAVLFMLGIFLFVGIPLIKFASNPQQFRDWVDSAGIWGRVLFVLMVIFQVIVAIIPGEPFEIAAGYAFGASEGTLLTVIGSFLGSVFVFLLVRKFGMKFVELFFSEEKLKSVKFLHTAPKKDLLFFVIFLIPGTPKDLLCYFAGLTDMPLGVWLFISSFGRLPSVITSTVGGSALGEKNYLFAAIVFVATLLISGAGILIYRTVSKKHQK